MRAGGTAGRRTAVSPDLASTSVVDPVGHGVVGIVLEVEAGGPISGAGLGVLDRGTSEAVVLAGVLLDQRHHDRAGEVPTVVERDGVALAQLVRPGDFAAVDLDDGLVLIESRVVLPDALQGLDEQFGHGRYLLVRGCLCGGGAATHCLSAARGQPWVKPLDLPKPG